MMTMGSAVAGCWRERRVGSDAVCSCAVARARGAGDARTRRARARAVKMRVGDTAAALVSDAVLVKGSTRDGFRSREATTRRRAPLYDTRRVLYIRALRRHKGGVYTNVFAVCARVIVFLVFLRAIVPSVVFMEPASASAFSRRIAFAHSPFSRDRTVSRR